MDFETFLEQVNKELQAHFPEMDIEIHSIEKLQGESYKGISVSPRGSNAGASLNMEAYYNALQEGMPLTDILSQINDLAQDSVSLIPQIDPGYLMDYNRMKDNLIMQAVPTEPNREMLATVPHKEIEDISIVYRFLIDHDMDKASTILVTNQMLQNYGITAEQLMTDADISAPLKNPVTIRSMEEVLAEMTGGMFSPEEIGGPSLLVATVPSLINGAGILGYPDFFKEAADHIGGNFFLLPSSIHELLLLPDNNGLGAEELTAMVSTVNAAEVMPEDQLSNEAYHYDVNAQIFEKASAYESRMISEQSLQMVNEETIDYAPEMEPEMISVLLVEPNRPPKQIEIGTDLEDLQKAVGGYIEVTYPFDDPVGLVMNEEGKLNSLPLNRALRDKSGKMYDIVAGPFMVVGLTEDSFGSLTPEQTQKYEKMFHHPEAFIRMSHGLTAVPLPDINVKTPDEQTEKKAVQKKTVTTVPKRKPDHDAR